MPITLEELRTFVRVCDPQRPLDADDPLYVPFDEGEPTRGSTHASCIQALYRFIHLKDETCQLFTGFPGTGKTTELRRLRAMLGAARDLPTHAVYIDFEEYLDRYTPVTITDVLRTAAYCLDREATIAEGKDPDAEPGYLRRLYDFLTQTDVELKQLGFHGPPTFMLELKNNPSFRARAAEALSTRFQQFAADAAHAMSEAIVRLRRAPGTRAERVVVLADGLEKFTPLREEERRAMEASVETVFVQHARFLRLPCHVVYTFPLWLRFQVAELGSLYDAQPLILPMVKISNRDGSRYLPGVDKLCDLVGRRIHAPNVFGESWKEPLKEMVLASGGYPRDLLRMVRELLVRAEAFPVDEGAIERVIRDLAQEYAFVVRGTHLPLLRTIAESHSLPQGDSEEVAAFGRLLEKWLVLAYRNGDEWYDLHPLVRRAPMVRAELGDA